MTLALALADQSSHDLGWVEKKALLYADSELIRVGIIGVGNMGSSHADALIEGRISRAKLVGVADYSPGRLSRFADQGTPTHQSFAGLVKDGNVDAVIIATPHFDHVPLAVNALEHGLHVLVEKPIAVHIAHAQPLLLASAKHSHRVFAAMFNQRTDPKYLHLKQLIQSGTLGRIQRINWIITDWFRTQAYYDSGGWRATWAGEGGGVLLNQCPHNLDLWQWLFGMPFRVTAKCRFGLHHSIEVEDDITAFFEYRDGASGVLVASTGEAPGTNRLEVAAEFGKVVVEGYSVVFEQNTQSSVEFCRTSTEPFAKPACSISETTFGDVGQQHDGIIQNFIDAIADGAPLIAPGVEGVRSVELANAILISGRRDASIELPLAEHDVVSNFEQLIADSHFDPDLTVSNNDAVADMSKRFHSRQSHEQS